MPFPATRLRRLRQNDRLRNLVRETRLTPDAFIYPLFVCPGEGVRKPVSSMPGVANLSVDEVVKEARAAYGVGVRSVILFGVPTFKDDVATSAWEEDGIVQKAAKALRREIPDLIVVGDVCLCEYMSHGHCGVVQPKTRPGERPQRAVSLSPTQQLGAAVEQALAGEYEIMNDITLELLARTAVSQARAGMDVIAPSDMMDGRVGAIRKALDEAGFLHTPI